MIQIFLMVHLSDLKLNEATRTTSDVFRLLKKTRGPWGHIAHISNNDFILGVQRILYHIAPR